MHDNSTNYVMVNFDGCESSTVIINYGQPMIITKVAVYHPNCDGRCDYQVIMIIEYRAKRLKWYISGSMIQQRPLAT